MPGNTLTSVCDHRIWLVALFGGGNSTVLQFSTLYLQQVVVVVVTVVIVVVVLFVVVVVVSVVAGDGSGSGEE